MRELLPARFRAWLDRARLARLGRLPTSVLGPEFSPNQRRIEVDITHACQMACVGCNRSCGRAASSDEMTVEQIERFVQDSRDAGWEWEEITLMGGEPTEHTRFLEIVETVARFARGRAGTKVIVKSNGNSARAQALLARVPRDVIVVDSKKQRAEQSHFQAFNVAPCDVPEYSRVDYSNACAIPEHFGLGLTRAGYYCCAVAASIDRVLGLDVGVKKLLLLEGALERQLRLFCKFCGHFRRSEPQSPRDMSPFWERVYSRYHSSPPTLSLY